jgi:hypothetical protein
MKVPLQYPKIPSSADCPLKQCIAFDKLDGTNIHIVWKNDKAVTFGTRRDQFPLTESGEAEFCNAHPELGRIFDSNQIIMTNLSRMIRNDNRYYDADELVLFFELYGEGSFAGNHTAKIKTLYLIDAQINGRILTPKEFLADFWGFEANIPKVIYRGKYSGQFVEDVRNGKYRVNEGVICKGEVGGKVYSCKIKTNEYMEKLKGRFQKSWQDHWE